MLLTIKKKFLSVGFNNIICFFVQVLFTCLKRNDKKEVKVAQLAGSVAEHSAYHHGEASLMGTIINLAQNYVGSNNINLLLPIGQFGNEKIVFIFSFNHFG